MSAHLGNRRSNRAETSEQPAPRRTATRRAAVRATVAGGLVVAGVGALASGALAAAVAPSPADGPTSCARLSERFNGGAAWTEIRFSTLPAVGESATGKAKGVLVTITRTSDTTLGWHSSAPIDLAWVNAGKPPASHSAAYHYRPAATADKGLTGTNGQDSLDHALFCFGGASPATTEPPATVPPTSEPATPEPPTVTVIPPDESLVPPTVPEAITRWEPQISRTPAPSTPRQTSRSVTTTVVPRLPETGSSSGPLVVAGLGLLGLGIVALGATRRPKTA